MKEIEQKKELKEASEQDEDKILEDLGLEELLKQTPKGRADIIEHSESEDDVELLADVSVPSEYYNRIRVGVGTLDVMFGGDDYPGLVRNSSILWTGGPGAGKSTAAAQLVDALVEHNGMNALYNTGEEHKFMVKMRSDRIGIRGNFSISTFGYVETLLGYCKKNGIDLLVVDSVQQLKSANPEIKGDKANLEYVGKALHRFANQNKTIVLAIGHVTKKDDFAGPMLLKHTLDVHLHIYYNANDMRRAIKLTKNRHGPTGIPYDCNLTARGLDFAGMRQSSEDPDDEASSAAAGETKAASRREAIEKLIEEKFLAGEHISAYCFTRFEDPFTKKVGIDINGSLWRVLVERVRNRLAANGWKVFEEKLNNRTHWYVEPKPEEPKEDA